MECRVMAERTENGSFPMSIPVKEVGAHDLSGFGCSAILIP